MSNPRSVPIIQRTKVGSGADPLVMVTAYDTPTANVVDAAGVDMILVGDSLAMVVLGYEDTRSVTTEQMAHHVGAVSRAKPDALIVADMPWMSYHLSTEDAVRNAATLVRSGAEAVKLEGGQNRLDAIEAIANTEIPVMGHLGLTPQSSLKLGGFKVQAKTAEQARDLIQQAKMLESVGCFSIVLEGIPSIVGQEITQAISIPTIGIGAGPDTDGQVLVFHDIVGLASDYLPRFVRQYCDSYDQQVAATAQFAADVRSNDYPKPSESYAGPEKLRDQLSDQQLSEQ